MTDYIINLNKLEGFSKNEQGQISVEVRTDGVVVRYRPKSWACWSPPENMTKGPW